MSNVLALQKPSFSLTPSSLAEAMEFAGMMSKSSIVPKDYQNNPGNILVAIQWGMEIGLQPLQSMQSIAVINGRPSIWGDAMLALVRSSGLLEAINEEVTDTKAVCTIKRRGEQEVVREFSMQDAKQAGLSGKQGPWAQYPKRMLQMRARAFAMRDVFPDVLRGVHVAEEAQDMSERDMGAADVVGEVPTASRTSALKAKLLSKQEPAALGSVLAQIAESTGKEGLAKAKEMAGKLNEEDRATAAEAYKARVAELKRAAAQVNKETGEVAAPMTYAQVAAMIESSKDQDTLDVALDMIRLVEDELQRDELVGISRRVAKAIGASESAASQA
jgi:hypothetical protein